MLQKGWLLAWCRSSMDLLQDLALSKKPSSPLSSPSKSNLGPNRADAADRRHDRSGGGWKREEEVEGGREEGRLGQQGSTGGRGGRLSQNTVMTQHDKAQQTL